MSIRPVRRARLEAAPYRVVEVGKWWGLFRVPATATSQLSLDEEPETVSWHATEAEAERAAASLATGLPGGYDGDVGYEAAIRVKMAEM